MIVNLIRDKYRDSKPSSGNPTGSRFGTCTAQLQQLLYPSITHPEPIPPRSRMVMEEGKRVEQWIQEEARALIPAQWGLEQFPFYFAIPLDTALVDATRRRVEARYKTDGRLWGVTIPGFMPPKMALTEDGKYRFRGITDEARQTMRDGTVLHPPVLDPDAQIFYSPIYVDAVGQHPRAGLSIVEIKALSNFSFRRAAMGNISYGYRCQMAGAAEATGFNVVWVAYRKETSHLAEITMERAYAGRTRLEVELLNGTREVLFVAEPPHDEDIDPALVTEGGAAEEFPKDHEWDVADVQTPFDAGLVEEIRERIRRVLGTTPGAWHREFGPDFVCRTCGGTGQQTLRKGSKVPLKTPKGCEDCEMMGWVKETVLKFPCTYCACIKSCYPMARLEVTERPTYYVAKADWERAGLSFSRPKSF